MQLCIDYHLLLKPSFIHCHAMQTFMVIKLEWMCTYTRYNFVFIFFLFRIRVGRSIKFLMLRVNNMPFV